MNPILSPVAAALSLSSQGPCVTYRGIANALALNPQGNPDSVSTIAFSSGIGFAIHVLARKTQIPCSRLRYHPSFRIR
jgi:hypothetical protein